MKKLCGVLLGVALLGFFACEKKVDIKTETKNVQSVLDQWVKAIETNDIDLLSKVFAHDEDIVVFGTDPTQHWTGWEAFKESMADQSEDMSTVKYTRGTPAIKIHDSGKVAWFSEIADLNIQVQDQQIIVSGVRVTGVLENRNGIWVVVQAHLSTPQQENE